MASINRVVQLLCVTGSLILLASGVSGTRALVVFSEKFYLEGTMPQESIGKVHANSDPIRCSLNL